MRGLWPLLARSLRVRRLRGVLTAASVALGVAAVLGVQLTLAGLDRQAASARDLRAGRSQLDVRASAGRGLTPAQLDAVRQVPGVAELEPLDLKRVAARATPYQVDAVTVSVIGVSPRGEVALRPVQLRRGRLPGSRSLGEVAVDEAVLNALSDLAGRRLDLGATVQLTTATGPDAFVVVGVTAGTSGGAAFTRSAAFVSDRAARDPFALGIHTPLVALGLRSGATSDQVAGGIRRVLGDVAVTSDPRAVSRPPLDELRPLLLLVTVLSLLIGAGVTANSTALSAAERRREIGLLRTAGASPLQVLRLLLAESAILAGVGAVAGVGLGIGLAAILVHLAAPAGLGVPAISLSASALLAALAAGIGAGLAGAALPVFAAARTPPLAAVRTRPDGGPEALPRPLLGVFVPLFLLGAVVLLASGNPTAAAGGVAALLVGVALTMPWLAPPLARGFGAAASPLIRSAPVAAANLRRRRNRTALTVAGLAVSVATATALSALTVGALGAADTWVSRLFVGSQVLVSPATASDTVAADIASRDGVTVSRVRFLSAPVEGSITGFASIDPAPYRDQRALDFVEGDREAALEALGSRPSLVVPEQLADARGWHRGVTVTVDAPDGPHRVPIVGVVAHSLPAGDGREALLLGHQRAVDLLGAAAAGFDDLEIAGGDSSAARVASTAQGYGMQAQSVADIRDATGRALRHSAGVLEAVSWLAVAVSMLAVVNTLVVNVRQGERDLALIRAVGLSRRSALRLVLVEAALLALVGSLVGVALGCVAAVPLLRASSSTAFSPHFSVPLSTVALVIAAVLAGSLCAAVAPARRAAGVSVVGAIRHE